MFEQEIPEHFGCDDRSITEIDKRQVAKEEVHWSVESCICPDDQDQTQVAHHCEEVNRYENHKEGHLQLLTICEAQENKFCHLSAIHLSHIFSGHLQ